MCASGLQCRVGLGFSRAAQRDDGHGGDSGGQRRRGDAATAIVVSTTAIIPIATITGLADGYNAGISGCQTIVIRDLQNGGVGSFVVVDVDFPAVLGR